ncbi:ribosome-binding factor A [Psychrobacter sp. YP14]|uniref:Ribosome-binding factor A n=3 Tax=Psychrobacter TaxID=497 RepID=RBFA_PSYWF|nr:MULTISPECIES: ribosome-binding factor A [Psychrobacter]A5WBS6.1 RecName: Full=Ribosome-binding factor A [Psychrobacter sp. PRwf-1]AWT48215.1 ribosome-binding factor A [Psychrobacter sp. YP14]MUG31656.1 ribosome-binding factor A [Psychrobacter sanguinis]UNK05532.1 ribosome-binding factor A [Psychrobacter sp. PraFG1]
MNQRLQRLGDQIQRELAVLIRDDVNDPRLTGFVTISSVKVSSDLGYADVYVTIMEPELNDAMSKHSHEESLKVLNKAAGFLRTELSHSLKTRTTPRLRFHYDEVTARGNYMMDLINKAVTKTEQTSADDDADRLDSEDRS